MIKILSTKTLPKHCARWLQFAGFALAQADFIRVEPIAFDANLLQPNLIISSSNALESLKQHPLYTQFKTRPVFCVGVKTAQRLQAEGFTVLAQADYAHDLAAQIVQQYPNRNFSFCSGNLRRDTLPNALNQAQISWNEVPVYQTQLQTHSLPGQWDALLFFSPSGVTSFLTHNSLGEAHCFCIGRTTALPLQSLTTKLHLAAQPTVEQVVWGCIQHFNPDMAQKIKDKSSPNGPNDSHL